MTLNIFATGLLTKETSDKPQNISVDPVRVGSTQSGGRGLTQHGSEALDIVSACTLKAMIGSQAILFLHVFTWSELDSSEHREYSHSPFKPP